MIKSLLLPVLVMAASCSSTKDTISPGTDNRQNTANTIGKPAAVSVPPPSPENSATSPDAPAKPADKHNH